MKELRYTGNAPKQAHVDDAGYDLISSEDVVIPAGSWKLVGTNLKIALEPGNVAMVCPRSGLAYKKGVTVLNSPGIVDAGYRGEIKVNLINHGKEDFVIQQGDRIAQLLIVTVGHPTFIEVETLDETQRGSGGHGSTGV